VIVPDAPVWEAVLSGRYKARFEVLLSAHGVTGVSDFINVTDRILQEGMSPIESLLGVAMEGFSPPVLSIALRNDDNFLTPGHANGLWSSAKQAYMTRVRVRVGIEGTDGAWQYFNLFTGVLDAVNMAIDQAEVRAASYLGWLDRIDTSEEYDVPIHGTAQYPGQLDTAVAALIDDNTPFSSSAILDSMPQADWFKFNGWGVTGIIPAGAKVGRAIRGLGKSMMFTAIDTEDGKIAMRSEFLPRDLRGPGTGYPWGSGYVPVTFDHETTTASGVIATDAIQSMSTCVTVNYLGGKARYVDETLEDELATSFGIPGYRVARTVGLPNAIHHWQAAWAARVIQEHTKIPKFIQVQTHIGLGAIVQLNDRVMIRPSTEDTPLRCRIVGKQIETSGVVALAAVVNPAETSIFEADFAAVGDAWSTSDGSF
jgi:hypothetical protein